MILWTEPRPSGRTVREYETADGKVPFRGWLATLDRATRARVQVRAVRFETGNLGDHKSVGGGFRKPG